MNRIQREVRKYVEEGYWGQWDSFSGIRHDLAHLVKLVGALGEYVEEREHYERCELNDDQWAEMMRHEDILKRLSADLVIFGARFAEYFGQDLDEVFDARMDSNRKKRQK